MHPFVVAITGASGAAYGVRLVEVLLAAGREVHLSISPAGQIVLAQELGLNIDLRAFQPDELLPATPSDDPRLAEVRKLAGGARGHLEYHHYQNFMAPIASGSFLTAGMVICPCSGSTLSGVVHGQGSNLIQRAADVHLKERRTLVLVPRETPLSVVQLENLHRAGQAGAVVLPAMPGFYHGAKTVDDLIDFVVARICDQLGVQHQLMRRWGSEPA
jgi:4-hydroxy-3-polyprenylbenzoate decarboxylase